MDAIKSIESLTAGVVKTCKLSNGLTANIWQGLKTHRIYGEIRIEQPSGSVDYVMLNASGKGYATPRTLDARATAEVLKRIAELESAPWTLDIDRQYLAEIRGQLCD